MTDLNISVRLLRALDKLGIVTLDDLMYKAEDDVMKVPSLGFTRHELLDLVESLDLTKKPMLPVAAVPPA